MLSDTVFLRLEEESPGQDWFSVSLGRKSDLNQEFFSRVCSVKFLRPYGGLSEAVTSEKISPENFSNKTRIGLITFWSDVGSFRQKKISWRRRVELYRLFGIGVQNQSGLTTLCSGKRNEVCVGGQEKKKIRVDFFFSRQWRNQRKRSIWPRTGWRRRP